VLCRAEILLLVLKHRFVPWPAKAVAVCALAYLFSPIQLIPTIIPVIGQLDDLFVLSVGLMLVRKMIPAGVLAECEAKAQSAWSRRLPVV